MSPFPIRVVWVVVIGGKSIWWLRTWLRSSGSALGSVLGSPGSVLGSGGLLGSDGRSGYLQIKGAFFYIEGLSLLYSEHASERPSRAYFLLYYFHIS